MGKQEILCMESITTKRNKKNKKTNHKTVIFKLSTGCFIIPRWTWKGDVWMKN